MKYEVDNIDESVVTLDTYNSDLNLVIDGTKYSAQPLTKEGFAFMWAGARTSHGASKGKFCFEVKVIEHLDVQHLPADEPNPHVVRVGFSVDSTSLQLGEDPLSYGYGGTGKISTKCQFKDFGPPFMAGDCVLAAADMSSDPVQIGFAKNGKFLGWAYKVWKSELQGKALFPHVLTKNCSFEVNLGQREAPYFPLPDNLKDYTFIGCLPLDQRVGGTRPPAKREDCEMIMMCGLPGAGKSVWAADYSQKNPEKKYNVLGTNNIIDKMKVMGLPRKRNYAGRWDVLIQMATKCLNSMFAIGSKLRRNYILDQTNVYPTAQRRKMRNFDGFKRIAVVVVPSEAEYKRRCDKRDREEGKEIPDSAVLEMKANFKLPEVGDIFDDIIFTELKRDEAEKLVQKYNEEGKASLGPAKKQFRPNEPDNKGFDNRKGNFGYNRNDMSGGRGDRDNYGNFPGDQGMRGPNSYGSNRGGFDNRGGFNGGRGGNYGSRDYSSDRGGFGDRGGYGDRGYDSRGSGFDNSYSGGASSYDSPRGGSRGGYDGNRGGGRGGYDSNRGSGRGGYERGRGGYDSGPGRGGFDSGRGGYDNSRSGGRGGYDSETGGRGGFDGGRGSSRGGFDSGRGSSRGGFDSGRGSSRGGFDSGRGSSRGGFDSGRGSSRGGFDSGRGSSRGGFDSGRGSSRGGFDSGRGSSRGGFDSGRGSSRGGFDSGRGSSRGGFDSSRGSGRGGYDSSRGSSRGGYDSGRGSGRGGSDSNRSTGRGDYDDRGSFRDNRDNFSSSRDFDRKDTYGSYGSSSRESTGGSYGGDRGYDKSSRDMYGSSYESTPGGDYNYSDYSSGNYSSERYSGQGYGSTASSDNKRGSTSTRFQHGTRGATARGGSRGGYQSETYGKEPDYSSGYNSASSSDLQSSYSSRDYGGYGSNVYGSYKPQSGMDSYASGGAQSYSSGSTNIKAEPPQPAADTRSKYTQGTGYSSGRPTRWSADTSQATTPATAAAPPPPPPPPAPTVDTYSTGVAQSYGYTASDPSATSYQTQPAYSYQQGSAATASTQPWMGSTLTTGSATAGYGAAQSAWYGQQMSGQYYSQ